MNLNLLLEESLIIDILMGALSYGWFKLLKKLFKEIGRLRGLFYLTDKTSIITNINDLNKLEKSKLKPFFFLKGKTEKIYKREGNYLKPDIILSNCNNKYLEDFFLNIDGGKVIVQPHFKMKYSNFDSEYIRNERTTLSKLLNFLFFSKSPVLKENQEIILFGQINESSNNIISEFENFKNIIPDYIEKGSNLSNVSVALRSIQINKTVLTAGLFLFCTGAAITLFYRIYWNYFKKFFFIKKKRIRIYCKKCNSNPCNVFCENCLELNEYCNGCFKNFQDEIDEGKITLNDIRCCKCSKKMEDVQYLVKN